MDARSMEENDMIVEIAQLKKRVQDLEGLLKHICIHSYFMLTPDAQNGFKKLMPELGTAKK